MSKYFAIKIILLMQFRFLSQNRVRNYQEIGENFIMRIFNICTPHPIIYSGDQLKKNVTGEHVAHMGEARCVRALIGENRVKCTIKIDLPKIGWKGLVCVLVAHVYKNSRNFCSR
jgi:hypothetical protein